MASVCGTDILFSMGVWQTQDTLDGTHQFPS